MSTWVRLVFGSWFGSWFGFWAVLILGFVASPLGVAAAKEDVRAAMREAGVAALPVFLDAATDSITIKFPVALGGGRLSFGGTVDAAALAQKRFVFKTSDAHKLSWNDAFGMPFLDLSQVALTLEVAKGEFEISLDGMLGGPFRKGGRDRAAGR